MNDALHRVRITGFGPLRDVTLEPGRLTVLVGANGVGKSHVLRAIRLATLMRNGSLQRFVTEAGGASTLFHYGAKWTHAIGIELDFVQGDKGNRYVCQLGSVAEDKLIYLDETVGFQRMRFAKMQLVSLGVGHEESRLREATQAGEVTAKTVSYWLSRIASFHFRDTSNNSPLRAYAHADDDAYLRSNGSNLASFLLRLEKSEAEVEQQAWDRINEYVRRVTPSVTKLCPKLTSNGVRLEWTDDQGERFNAQQLSDGTLRAIALITALAQPTERRPRFICIDEPELGLHPAAIQVLAELARLESPHTQVLFATQSPEFLDFFETDEVVVVERKDGSSQLNRPDTDTLKRWIEDYSQSEIFETTD